MENADVFLGLHDFLERMRHPSAADFVKSIKSFIVSFSNVAPDPERDSVAVQEFLANMEVAFRAHPLWAGCSEEELDSAGEGLEKYVMTKLFTRVFASLPDDVKVDEQLSEKMSLIQQFIRPENLDIKPTYQNESSWLLAQKELQKINMYKAPRDKLVCILNCCKVINNLLLNASIASNENPPGADEFLPVLIYVTIKANPPQLHSNLLYIQRYRCQSRLVGEAAYCFTNMLSSESFISSIDGRALSMDESEFENNMVSARALLSSLSTDMDSLSNQSDHSGGTVSREQSIESHHQASNSKKEKESTIHSKYSKTKSGSKRVPEVPSFSDLQNKGAAMLLEEGNASQIFQDFPYLFANVGDLTINDVEDLLNNYKQLVIKYVCVSKGLGIANPSPPSSNMHAEVQRDSSNMNTEVKHDAETAKEPEDRRTAETNEESQKDTGRMGDDSNRVLVPDEEKVETHSPPEDEGNTHKSEEKDVTYQ